MPGSRMASSSTMIETACPTGDTGSTICLLTRADTWPAHPSVADGSAHRPNGCRPGAYCNGSGPPCWAAGHGPCAAPGPSIRGSDRMPASGSAAAAETTTGSSGWGFELDMPFYAWASVIVDGRVVATDYAPDAGWLVATRGARPGGTFLLGDPFPHLSMAVPEGWTRSSTNPGSSRIGAADMLKRVTCGDPRPVEPGAGREDFHCATVRFDVIDDPEELLRRRERAALRVQLRRSRDLLRGSAWSAQRTRT